MSGARTAAEWPATPRAGPHAGGTPSAPAAGAPGAATPGALVWTRALSFRYRRDRAALGPVELAVACGEIVALAGPNGSGKSTLLRLLAGDLRATSGTAVRAAGTSMGYAADEAVHLDALDTRENAAFFARVAGGGAAVAAVDRLLEVFGLGAEAATPAAELSFGGRRKLLLVEALAHGPDLLLLDEPTVGLDAAAVAALEVELRAAAGAGGAVVMATNDLYAAEALATRVVFLHEGRVVADAPPDVLLDCARRATRIEVAVPPPRPSAVAFPPGVVALETPDGWTLEAAAGSAALPEVCAALAAAGVRVETLRVRPPDLADAFAAVTGTAWREEA